MKSPMHMDDGKHPMKSAMKAKTHGVGHHEAAHKSAGGGKPAGQCANASMKKGKR